MRFICISLTVKDCFRLWFSEVCLDGHSDAGQTNALEAHVKQNVTVTISDICCVHKSRSGRYKLMTSA